MGGTCSTHMHLNVSKHRWGDGACKIYFGRSKVQMWGLNVNGLG